MLKEQIFPSCITTELLSRSIQVRNPIIKMFILEIICCPGPCSWRATVVLNVRFGIWILLFEGLATRNCIIKRNLTMEFGKFTGFCDCGKHLLNKESIQSISLIDVTSVTS